MLTVIGHDQSAAVIEREVAAILAESTLSHTAARFLIEMGHMDAAETYQLDRAEQLNGDFYGGLLSLAEAMDSADRPLCTSVIYRTLLDSILRRAWTKTYPHGVRYLKKLDKFAVSITNWRNIANHADYTEHLEQKHGRKRSFWSRYKK